MEYLEGQTLKELISLSLSPAQQGRNVGSRGQRPRNYTQPFKRLNPSRIAS
jgi:hypothetical protein